METYVFKSSEGHWYYSVPIKCHCSECPAQRFCSDKMLQKGVGCADKYHYEKIPNRLFQEGDIIYWKGHKYCVRSDTNRSGKLCHTCPFHGSCVGNCYCGIGLYAIPAEGDEPKAEPKPVTAADKSTSSPSNAPFVRLPNGDLDIIEVDKKLYVRTKGFCSDCDLIKKYCGKTGFISQASPKDEKCRCGVEQSYSLLLPKSINIGDTLTFQGKRYKHARTENAAKICSVCAFSSCCPRGSGRFCNSEDATNIHLFEDATPEPAVKTKPREPWFDPSHNLLEYPGDLESKPWFASVEAEFIREMDRQNQLNFVQRMQNMQSSYPMIMCIDPIYPTSPKPPDKTNSRSRRASLKPNINPITPLKWKTKNKNR